MLNGYLRIPKIKALLVNPTNPLSDQISSYKGIPPSALINWKGSTVAGIALTI